MDAKRKAAHRGNGRHEATTRVRLASGVKYTLTPPHCQIRKMRVIVGPLLAVCARLGLVGLRDALLALCVRWGRCGR